MKKITSSIFVVSLIVSAIVLFVFTSCSDKKQALKPIEDPLFVYVNLEQLAVKGAFDKFVTPENRTLIATAMSSQMDNNADIEHLENIINNLGNIGIDTQKPIYGYINDDLTDCAIIARVIDVAQLDRTVALLSYLLEEGGEDALEVVRDGDMRTFEHQDIYVAYNSSALAVAFGESDDVMSVAIDGVNRPQMDMSVFATDDIAVLVNADKCMQLASKRADDAIAELNDMYLAGEIDEEMFNAQNEALVSSKATIDSYMPYFAPNSNVKLSLTFDLGRMTLAYNTQGVNFVEYANIIKPTNYDHLSRLGKDSYMAMSAGVDGTLLAQFIRDILDSGMLENAGFTPTNEVNMVMSIVCDAISTINGGVTLALENIEGKVTRQYDYYWDVYDVTPSIDGVKAILMADVADTYIINNIAMFAGGFLKKEDATHYSLSLMDYNFTMGQDDGLFHIGVNMTPKVQTQSALEADWAKEVEGALSYMVVNVDALMSGEFMTSVNEYVATQLLEEYRGLYKGATEVVSYICASTKSLDSAEFVVVFDQSDVNALEQINALVLPVLIKESIQSLY